jgi:glucose-1-phosphate cytidylyltransferase
VNGGFFVFRSSIFDYMREGEELVLQPFRRLMWENQLLAYDYDGFWLPMDTAKDKARLDELHERGDAPWYVWKPVKASVDALPRIGAPGALLSTDAGIEVKFA